jgi:hypothetical protein
MKRDLDLVREILLAVEAHPTPMKTAKLTMHGRSPDEVSYHVKLMAEAGLVQAIDLSSHSGIEWRPTSLTWEGHEFLDATRADTIWQKVKAILKDKGIEAPLSVVQNVAIKLVATSLGLKD